MRDLKWLFRPGPSPRSFPIPAGPLKQHYVPKRRMTAARASFILVLLSSGFLSGISLLEKISTPANAQDFSIPTFFVPDAVKQFFHGTGSSKTATILPSVPNKYADAITGANNGPTAQDATKGGANQNGVLPKIEINLSSSRDLGSSQIHAGFDNAEARDEPSKLMNSPTATKAKPRSPTLSSTYRGGPSDPFTNTREDVPLVGQIERGFKVDGLPAYATSPVIVPLECTVELFEGSTIVASQVLGCTQIDNDNRGVVLMDIASETSATLPNMHYSVSVQVDGYKQGSPIIRSRLVLNGLIGRSFGRRQYESTVLGKINKSNTLIAFNIEETNFKVKLRVCKKV